MNFRLKVKYAGGQPMKKLMQRQANKNSEEKFY